MHRDAYLTLTELLCCLVSGVVSMYCLCHLCSHRRSASRRLIWVQLVALGFADAVYSMYTIFFPIGWCIAGHKFEYCLLYSIGIMPLRNYLEFFSCVVEVHIALGFAVACHGYSRATTWLLYSFPLCFVFAAVLYWYVFDEFSSCSQTHPDRWAGVVFFACCMATLIYLSGLCCSSGRRVQRRAVARALSYLGSFVLTLGGRSAWMVLGQPCALDVVTLIGVNLNGGIIMGVYTWWMLRRSTSDIKALDNDRVSVMENLVLERYFDMSFQVDATVSSAAQLVAESVLEADKLRHTV